MVFINNQYLDLDDFARAYNQKFKLKRKIAGCEEISPGTLQSYCGTLGIKPSLLRKKEGLYYVTSDILDKIDKERRRYNERWKEFDKELGDDTKRASLSEVLEDELETIDQPKMVVNKKNMHIVLERHTDLEKINITNIKKIQKKLLPTKRTVKKIIVEMSLSGESVNEIAKELKMKNDTIKKIIQRLQKE